MTEENARSIVEQLRILNGTMVEIVALLHESPTKAAPRLEPVPDQTDKPPRDIYNPRDKL